MIDAMQIIGSFIHSKNDLQIFCSCLFGADYLVQFGYDWI